VGALAASLFEKAGLGVFDADQCANCDGVVQIMLHEGLGNDPPALSATTLALFFLGRTGAAING
jgi:hypothetical protein